MGRHSVMSTSRRGTRSRHKTNGRWRIELFAAALGASAAIIASPAIAQAESEEQGGPPPTSVGEEQPVTREQLADPGPTSVNDATPSAQPDESETEEQTEDLGAPIIIDQGASPRVVISSSGGAHTSGDQKPAARSRKVAEKNTSGSELRVAVANVEHDHGGGEPAPAPEPDPVPVPTSTGPVASVVAAVAPVVKPLVSPSMDPMLQVYLFLLGDQADIYGEHAQHAAPGTTFDQITSKWDAKLVHDEHMQEMTQTCKTDPGNPMCKGMGAGGHGSHGSHGSHGGGSMGDMSTMSMMSMMSMAGMEDMPHPECKGGLFLMCHGGSGVEATYNDHDVMFLNHMIPHHGQAVQMSRIVLAKPDLDPRVAALAEQIKAAQGPEIRLMETWLDSWGNPPSSMVGDHGILPGRDITALRQASGPDASVLFLQQMTYHHNGAVDASLGHLMGGQFDPSLRLASDIIGAQRTEIATMSDLLASLGAPATGPNVPVAPAAGSSPQPAGGGSSASSGGHHH